MNTLKGLGSDIKLRSIKQVSASLLADDDVPDTLLDCTKKMTREDALRRLKEARRLKREYVKELEKKMKEDFKKRTGQDAIYFEVW